VKTPSLARDGLTVFAGTSLGQLANLLLLSVLAHNSSVEEFGAILAAIGVIAILAGLIDFGTSSRWVRDAQAGVVTAAESSGYLSARLTTGVLGAVLLAVVANLSHGPVASALLALSPWLALRVISQARQALVQMKLRFAVQAQGQSLDRLTAAFIGILSLQAGVAPLPALSLAYSSGAVISILFLHLRDRQQAIWDFASAISPWKYYRRSMAFGATTVVTDLVALDLAVVTLVAGNYEAGLFALPSRITGPATGLTASLATVALAALASERSHRAALRRLYDGSRAAVVFLAISLTLLGLLAEVAVALVGGAEYAGATQPLRIFLVASAFVMFNQLMLAFLQGRGAERFAASVLVAGVLLSLAGVAVGAASHGAKGASFGYLFANLAIGIAFGIKVRQMARTSTD
jgi:O-antigen/teichoic acid export membrane protein